jgi:TIR domain
MSDIFISYSSEDRDRILPLVTALEKTGWKVFWDRTIPPGKTWRQVISFELEGCRSLLVVWTKNSVTSEWVLEEAEIGRRKGILIPVLLDNVEPPMGFRNIQAANLMAWDGNNSSPTFSRLIADIATARRQEERERLREEERQQTEKEARSKENQRHSEKEGNQAERFFFSYARADSEFVLTLADDLRSNGVNIWLDQLDIPGGVRWDAAVEEALHASPCLLVVLSSASVASNNVMDEVSFGLETDKRIVPILFKDCTIPFRLKRLHYIDFRAGYDEGFKRLIQTLKPVNQLSTGQREQSDRRNFHLSWKLNFRGFSASLSVTLMGILAVYLVLSLTEKAPIEIPNVTPSPSEPPTPSPSRPPTPSPSRPPTPSPSRPPAPSPSRPPLKSPSTEAKEIAKYISLAREHRLRGEYDEALSQLNIARELDSTNIEVASEIEATRRACNAEQRLGRTDLGCP